jgi:hypothetical protein
MRVCVKSTSSMSISLPGEQVNRLDYVFEQENRGIRTYSQLTLGHKTICADGNGSKFLRAQFVADILRVFTKYRTFQNL